MKEIQETRHHLSEIIFGHYLTEKSARFSENAFRLQYFFKVNKNANKILIRKVVEQEFSVKVFAVNVINVLGKKRHFRGVSGKKNDWKKACVTLEHGHVIDIESKIEKS